MSSLCRLTASSIKILIACTVLTVVTRSAGEAPTCHANNRWWRMTFSGLYLAQWPAQGNTLTGWCFPHVEIPFVWWRDPTHKTQHSQFLFIGHLNCRNQKKKGSHGIKSRIIATCLHSVQTKESYVWNKRRLITGHDLNGTIHIIEKHPNGHKSTYMQTH